MLLAIAAWVAWAVGSPLVYLWLGARLNGSGSSLDSRKRVLAGYLVWMPVFNALFGGIAPAWLWSSGMESPGVASIVGGLAFAAGATVAQWLNSRALCKAARLVFGFTGTNTEFAERALARALSLVMPLASTAVVFGAGFEVFADSSNAAWPIVYAGSAAAWALQWGLLRRLTVPGRSVSFPNYAVSKAASKLAFEMGAPLHELLLTRSRLAAAYAMGIGQVVITDGLASALSERELLAVIAHELQHFKQRRRMFCLAIVGFGGAGASGGWLAFAASEDLIAPQFALAISIALAAVSFVPLGFLRRRNEDEADDAAAKFVGAEQLATALEKSAEVNGTSAHRRGWLHRSLVQRTARIRALPQGERADGILSVQAARLAGREWTGT